jgi:hypothetical protein
MGCISYEFDDESFGYKFEESGETDCLCTFGINWPRSDRMTPGQLRSLAYLGAVTALYHTCSRDLDGTTIPQCLPADILEAINKGIPLNSSAGGDWNDYLEALEESS